LILINEKDPKEGNKMLGRQLRLVRRQNDPWQEFDRIHRMMEDVFQGTGSPKTAPRHPAINLKSGEGGAELTAELPGLDPKDIEISIEGKTLTFGGERKAEDTEKDERYHRRERWQGKFRRTLELPFTIEAGKVKAGFKNGVLKITLPKAEAEKPKKISITHDN
jgi:HSP20 family protein